tara:strand:- start:904 stop:1203 length:300 start_codon:yes stop_codon:yes gene_type:complete
MAVKMIMSAKGATDATGAKVKTYTVGEIVDTSTEFGKNLAKTFIDAGWAEEIKVVEPTEVKRARNTDGTLRADDKETPDYNEAWEGGKAPQKKGSTKKK